MNKINLKSLTPHIVAILVFIALTLSYFNPLISGKAISQGDVKNFLGMSKEIVDYREKFDKEPLWTNSMFGGMPAYQISVKYPANLVRPLIKVTSMGVPHPASIVFLCMIGFYFLLLSLKVDQLMSVAGAIAFGFSTYFIELIEAGHNPKGYAIAYMAPIVMGVIMSYRGKPWLGAAITAIALSLELSVNHLQITYYLALLIGLLVVGELVNAIVQKQIPAFMKSSGLLIIAALLAIAPNITNLLVTQEYGKYSTRGQSDLTDDKANKTSGLDRDYATQWSYGIGETFTLMIPNFKGGESKTIGDNKAAMEAVSPDMRQYVGQSTDQYWGDQPFTSGPVYIGAIICFLCMLSLFILNDKLKWYLLAASILAIMLSWGKNFMGFTNFFMDYIPGYNKFRAVSMILVIVEFTFPLLAILVIKAIADNPELLKEKRKQFYIALAATAGMCFLFYLLPTTFQDFYKAGEYEDVSAQLKKSGASGTQITDFLVGMESARIAIFKSDALRSFFFILLGAGLLFTYSLQKFNKNYLYIGLGVLMLIDLWTVDKRYLNEKNFVSKSVMDTPYQPTPADEQIFLDKDPNFRVINTAVSTFNDASTSYFHKSIGGYHGAKLKRFQEIFEKQISKNNMAVLNMLNTKYFIVQNQQTGAPMAQRNPGALGNAWFVKELKIVANADSEISALTGFNPSNTAIVDQKFAKEVSSTMFQFDSTATIKLTEYKADELKYEYQAATPQLAVFSEIYYDKGWNAYIDGKLLPHVRADYVLRSMIAPAGKHNITFKFEPASYYQGEKLAMAGSILLYLFVALGIFLQFKNNNKSSIEKV